MSESSPVRTRVRTVGPEGIALVAFTDEPIDVLVDGRRVWTFWTLRDTDASTGRLPGPLRRVGWPRSLARHLDGRGLITLRSSAGGRDLFDAEVAFGSGAGSLEVRNSDGVELGIDKSGKLVPTFAGRSEGEIDSLLDATAGVITALRDAGLEPFLAYGTLLGAVREGRVLPHDSDADLGYVSRHTDPVDVCLESFRVQRELAAQGWVTSRYSGGAFKVSVTRGEVTTGLDVFGGFQDHGRLYLMGEIGTDVDEDWIRPLGTAELSGRPMPVPAHPDRLLEATYGPGWRVPDPAFQFTTPTRTVRALEDWFRGLQPRSRYWSRRVQIQKDRPLRPPSFLAKRARRLARELGGAQVLDIGAGRGGDSVWLAQQGLSVRAYDYVPKSLDRAARIARRDGLDLEVVPLNLTEWRSVLAEGALLARDPRPRVVLARHVLEATSGDGREMLTRLCSMALREGGHLLADVMLGDEIDEDPGDDRPDWMVGRVDVERLTEQLRHAGARSVRVKRLGGKGRPTVRVLGEW